MSSVYNDLSLRTMVTRHSMAYTHEGSQWKGVDTVDQHKTVIHH